MGWKTALAALFVTVLAWGTYFSHYDEPSQPYWDENYHIASAQKYLHGVFFMEPHPPLGKLLIALGEKLTHANAVTDQFIGSDFARDFPDNFNFRGYRFFPALFGWLCAPLIFFCFLLITNRLLWALLLSSAYVFENAIIVHSRGAMLESTQCFFMLLALSAFLLQTRSPLARRHAGGLALIMGTALGCAFATKLNALPLLVLIPALPFFRKGLALSLCTSAIAAISSFLLIWQIHFALGTRIDERLPNGGYYEASQELRAALDTQQAGHLVYFPLALQNSANFVASYEKGVEALNLCKQDENGSPAFFWPLGGRSIAYRWDKQGDFTSWIYLQVNPSAWFLGLAGIILSTGLLFAALFFSPVVKLANLPLLLTLQLIYWSYMGGMASLERVTYLYHYILPFIISLLLFAVSLSNLQRFTIWKLSERFKTVLLLLAACTTIGCFNYFSPLTYHQPIDKKELAQRNWLPLWDIHCKDCPLTNGIAAPLCDPKIKPAPPIKIGELACENGIQDWGEPIQDYSVDQKKIVINGVSYDHGIGVHANSEFRFRTAKRYSIFEAAVGVPDLTRDSFKPGRAPPRGSVVFSVLGDGRELWRSPVLRNGEPATTLRVAVDQIELLTLKVTDAGDGIDNDHACWVNPNLK
ncbi:MAG: NPCBM/NEW2 domain-containing protein [Oligoflexia bacterium]|nr:NPCBM/NEW2 domain-containing protein [Oligoflexia bacterium]